ncbi:hypothetical protein YB2330_004542 [Saitoella coloradoensis]
MKPQCQRKSRRSCAFVVFLVATIAVIYILGLVGGYGLPADTTRHNGIGKRDLIAELVGHKGKAHECADVFTRTDKCAYVRKHCHSDSLLNYLELYFCAPKSVRMSLLIGMVLLLASLFSTVGLASSDFFCPNLATISHTLSLPESVAGVTLLAFGNGSPDLFSTFASFSQHSSSLAIGELVGAASFICAVVAGSMAIVRPFGVVRRAFLRDVGFFLVAVCFTTGFLADGRLYFWESVVMVVYYVVYAGMVVGTTYVERKRHRRRMERALIRHQFESPGADAEFLDGNEEAEESAADENTSLLGRSADDVRALTDIIEEDEEAGPSTPSDDHSELESEYRELNSSMALVRTADYGPSRIRPSLFGALELRSIVNSLQQNSAVAHQLQLSPGTGPRFRGRSVSPRQGMVANAYARGQGLRRHTVGMGSAPDPDALQPVAPSSGTRKYPVLDRSLTDTAAVGRARSVTGAASDYFSIGRLSAVEEQAPIMPAAPVNSPQFILKARDDVPQLRIDTATPVSTAPNSSESQKKPNEPVVPSVTVTASEDEDESGGQIAARVRKLRAEEAGGASNSMLSPTAHYSHSPIAMSPSQRYASPRSTPPLSPAAEVREVHDHLNTPLIAQATVPRWWPKALLPDPIILRATLFPTTLNFWEKPFSGKVVSLLAIVPVLALTVTLPVVETSQEQGEKPKTSGASTPAGSMIIDHDLPVLEALDDAVGEHVLKGWNRWLTGVQCIMAPVFLAFIMFFDEPLLHPMLYALVAGLAALGLLITFTEPGEAPLGHSFLSYVGFIVAVGWISTIANEVVGVLRALGLILGISEAILGLTVFAVGNSLGDLIADITIAKMGFSMMAFSACIGGPMMNILLGIGISGIVATLKEPDHTYPISLSPTLVITTSALIVTLIGLLVSVPRSGYKMTRKIGMSLLAIWGVATITNVVVEVIMLN